MNISHKNQFKKITYLLGFVLFIQFIISCKSSDEKIIGEWRGTSSDSSAHPIRIIFDKTQRASVQIADVVVGGKEDNTGNGRKVELAYKVDYSKIPHTIDLRMLVDGIANKESFIKGIFRFISDNKMEVRMWLGDSERFTGFDSSDKENQTILEKTE